MDQVTTKQTVTRHNPTIELECIPNGLPWRKYALFECFQFLFRFVGGLRRPNPNLEGPGADAANAPAELLYAVNYNQCRVSFLAAPSAAVRGAELERTAKEWNDILRPYAK